jgi:hypothetical protein
MENGETTAVDTRCPGQMAEAELDDPALLEAHADRLLGEGLRVVGAVAHAGLTLRLTGGMAVRYYALDRRFADRAHTDIDLVGLKRESGALVALLGSLGYLEDGAVSLATANGQLRFYRTHLQGADSPLDAGQSVQASAPYDHIDVFLDAMDMDHTLPMRDRLKLDRYAISPADLLLSKLQVGRFAEKDAHDVITLCKDLPPESSDWPRVLNLRYVAVTCADDWGLYTDVLENAAKVLALLDGYRLSEQETLRVRTTLELARQTILDEPKSTRFRLRARVGRRLPWRRDVEETYASRDVEVEPPEHHRDGPTGREDAAA